MRPVIDTRDLEFWEKIPPEQRWPHYRDAQNVRLDAIFGPERVRPLVQIRDHGRTADSEKRVA